jgi:heme oxygenase
MPRRPTQKTLESLHVTLQKLEQTENSVQDEESISELKRVLLNRIVDLELSKTLETGVTETETEIKPEPADLVLPKIEEEKTPSDQRVDLIELEKLD